MQNIVKKLKEKPFANGYITNETDESIRKFKKTFKDFILFHSFSSNKKMENHLKEGFSNVDSNDRVEICQKNVQFTKFLNLNEIKKLIKTVNNPGCLFMLSFGMKIHKMNDDVFKDVKHFLQNASITQKFLFLKYLDDGKNDIKQEGISDIRGMHALKEPYGNAFDALKLMIKVKGRVIFNELKKLSYVEIGPLLDAVTGAEKKSEFLKKYKKELFELKETYEENLALTLEGRTQKIELIDKEVILNTHLNEIFSIFPINAKPTIIDFLSNPIDVSLHKRLDVPNYGKLNFSIYSIQLSNVYITIKKSVKEKEPILYRNTIDKKFDEYFVYAFSALIDGKYMPAYELFQITLRKISKLINKSQVNDQGVMMNELTFLLSFVDEEMGYFIKMILENHPEAMNARNILSHFNYHRGLENSALHLIWVSVILMNKYIYKNITKK